MSQIWKRFGLNEHRTTWKQEWTAGVTAYFTAAYILVVNPLILRDAGIPLDAAVVATIAASVIGCWLMGFWANAPIILIPGMGVNAFFSYTMVQSIGLSWQAGLAAVVLSGILFWIISVTPLGKSLAEAVPASLKHGITAGIGLFLTFIGLQKGEVIRSSDTTFVTLGNLDHPPTLLTWIGVVVTLILFLRKVKGSFLIGIILTTLLSLWVEGRPAASLPSPSREDFGTVFAAADWGAFTQLPWIIATFSLSMILIFENMGLLNGMLPDPAQFPRAYQSTAVSSLISGLVGTSPTIAAAESASGIAEGGRTGIPAIVAGMLFLLSFFAVPLIGWIPDHAVAPVLIIVGGLMMQSVRHIPFSDFAEAFPAFLIIALIPLTFSIADGLAFGFITYPLVQFALGNHKRVHGGMYIIAGLFLFYFFVSHSVLSPS